MKTTLRINVVGLVLIMLLGGLASRFLLHAPTALSILLGALTPVALLLAVALLASLRTFVSGGAQFLRAAADHGHPVVVYEDDIMDLLILVEVGEIRDPEGYIKDFANRVGFE